MNTRNRSAAAAIAVLAMASLAVAACNEEPTVPDGMVDAGSWYSTGFHWPHDGNPYETEHFIVFSDAASLEARMYVAEVAESLIGDIIDDFGIDPETMFRWPPGQSKIHIYAYRDHFVQWFGGKGYYGGMLMWSLDHEIRSSEPENYAKVVTHELTHVMEGLLKGTVNPKIIDVWMSEGIAEYMSGGTSHPGNITSRAMLDSLVAARNVQSPIQYHFYEDFPGGFDSDAGYWYLYSMFELSVRYLLDADGLGRDKSVIRDVWIDAGKGVRFSTSFEEKFGIGLAQYEEEYFDRIRAFLGG